MDAELTHNFDSVVSTVQELVQDKPIQIIAVSKKQPIEKMLAWEEFCRTKNLVPVFGENYVQELVAKVDQGLLSPRAKIHLIGPLQTNKVRDAVRYADVIQSVHSVKVLEKIISEAARQEKQQKIFLQINVSSDSSKSGFTFAEVPSVLSKYAAAPEVHIVGLMTITRFYERSADVRPDFIRFREFRDSLASGVPLALSMGMSADFDIAIEEGATHVRIGSALFGERV